MAFFLSQAPPPDSTDAMALLTKVLDSLRTARSWRFEGLVTDIDGNVQDFHFAWGAPDLVRFESEGKESRHEITVCNGSTIWTCNYIWNSYLKLPVPRKRDHTDTESPYWTSRCGFDLWQWANRLKGISSATFVGHDTVQVGGQSRGCEEVRAVYPIKLTHRSGQLIITMCIDADRLQILWEKGESDYPAMGGMGPIHESSTSTYDLIERNPDLDSALFTFKPPPGATDRNLPRSTK